MSNRALKTQTSFSWVSRWVLLTLALLLFAGCSDNPKRNEPPETPLEIVAAETEAAIMATKATSHATLVAQDMTTATPTPESPATTTPESVPPTPEPPTPEPPTPTSEPPTPTSEPDANLITPVSNNISTRLDYLPINMPDEIDWEMTEMTQFIYFSGFGPWKDELILSPTITNANLQVNARLVNGKRDERILNMVIKEREFCETEGVCMIGSWDKSPESVKHNDGQLCAGGTDCTAPMIAMINDIYPDYQVCFVHYGQFAEKDDPRLDQLAIASVSVILCSR